MQTKVRPLVTLKATVGRRLSDTAARSRLKGKPSFRFGLSTVRFGLITVAVIAAGVALLTWLPSEAYNQPITHPVKAIADSVTKEPPKAEESKAVNVVRKGLETVSAGILNPISDQPASPSSVAPVPQAPPASEPAPALTPTSDWGSSSEAPVASDPEPPIYEVPAAEPEPAGAPAAEPVPEAPAAGEPEPAPVGEPVPAPDVPVGGPVPAPEAPTGEPTPIGPPAGEPAPAPEAPADEPPPAPPNLDD